MKEILFKAKAINRDNGYHRTNYKNGDWIYGLITRLFDDRFENLPAEMTDLNGVSGIEIDHNTICQYTGLADKNSKKIWENDVVKWMGKLYKVVFYESICSFVLVSSSGHWVHMEMNYGDKLECYDYEVIGNIFDNPELLEGGGEDED